MRHRVNESTLALTIQSTLKLVLPCQIVLHLLIRLAEFRIASEGITECDPASPMIGGIVNQMEMKRTRFALDKEVPARQPVVALIGIIECGETILDLVYTRQDLLGKQLDGAHDALRRFAGITLKGEINHPDTHFVVELLHLLADRVRTANKCRR